MLIAKAVSDPDREVGVIDLELSVDVLGNTTFAFSPLAEVGSSLRLLGEPRPAHLHSPWLRQVRDQLADVDLGLLLAVAPPGNWAPAFLYPRATGPHTTLEQQLNELADLPPEQVRDNLERVWSGRDLPARAREVVAAGPAGPAAGPTPCGRYWTGRHRAVMGPLCWVLEDDVSYRASMFPQAVACSTC
jgi:hypothetical protein